MLPGEADFEFKVPEGWGSNLLKGAALVEATAPEPQDEIAKIVDNRPATTWTSGRYGHRPAFTFDLGRTVEFNRLVFFNRHTDARGTGGGNNAAKHLAISGATADEADTFFTISEVTLPGPRAHCMEHEGRRACFFIDSTEPLVAEVGNIRARLLKVQILSAYWSPLAESTWPSELSYALSEVMVFLAADSSTGE
ncbi:MAG: discoidin domain-containing protein [bacterium]